MRLFGGGGGARSRLHADQLDLEHERRVGRDDSRAGVRVGLTLGAVRERRGDDELALATRGHAGDTFIPSGNHLALADREVEGLVARATRVEHSAVRQPSGVLHGRVVACAGDGAGADLQVDRLEAVGKDDRGQAVASVKVVSARARSRPAGALVGDRAVARVWIRIAARGRGQHDAGNEPRVTPPHVTVMSIEFIVSPTWILSITSIPDVTSPKWLYTPLDARKGASPRVMKNCDPLTPAALDAIPAVPRGHREGLLSSGSL